MNDSKLDVTRILRVLQYWILPLVFLLAVIWHLVYLTRTINALREEHSVAEKINSVNTSLQELHAQVQLLIERQQDDTANLLVLENLLKQHVFGEDSHGNNKGKEQRKRP